MASILETLAGISAEKEGPVIDILAGGYTIPWGVTSLYFACHRCRQTRLAKAFMVYRNIPACFVLAQKSNEDEIPDTLQQGHTVYLDNLLAPEDRKK